MKSYLPMLATLLVLMFATSYLLQGKLGITVIVGAIYWFLWYASTGRETDDRY